MPGARGEKRRTKPAMRVTNTRAREESRPSAGPKAWGLYQSASLAGGGKSSSVANTNQIALIATFIRHC